MKRKYGRWKNGKGSKEDYREGKKSLRQFLFVKRRKEKREDEEEELRNIRNEKEAWDYIIRRRKKRKWKENSMQKEEWRNHFIKLLRGMEMEVEDIGMSATRKMSNTDECEAEEEREKESIEKEQEEEKKLEEEKIARAVKKMKLVKVAGIDGIPIETWRSRYSSKEEFGRFN